MPSRAQRLYPRMRERPPEFVINRAWPRYHCLRLLIAASSDFTDIRARMRTRDAYNWQFTATNMSDAAVVWDGVLGRLVFELPTENVDRDWTYPNNSLINLTNSLSVFAFANPYSFSTISPYIRGIISQYNVTLWGGMTMRLNYQVDITTNDVPSFGVYSSSAPYIVYSTSKRASINQWIAPCGIVRGDRQEIWVDGSLQMWQTVPTLRNIDPTRIANDWNSQSQRGWHGRLADIMILAEPLAGGEIEAISDPSNVDLRIGGIPLILPPRRRLWPVAPVAEYVKRRQLGLRAGSREAVT